MIRPPSDRTRALETLLGRVQYASACLSNYGNWEDRARSYAPEDEVARMDAEADEARRAMAEAKPALEALVAATRAEAPAELTAWIDAHDAYLAAFIDDCDDKEYTDGFPTEARAKWAEVRAGTRAYVVDSGGVTQSVPRTANRYRWLFGIDPFTYEVSTLAKPAWLLSMQPSEARPVLIADCASALAAAMGVPATTTTEAAVGNPRDGYWRGVKIVAGPVELSTNQNMLWDPNDADPLTDLGTIYVKDSPDTTFAAKVSIWHAVREAFAALGCTDVTLAAQPARIVDEAVSAGEIETAMQLRKDITAALVAKVAAHGMIDLRRTRPDDFGAVLAAYPAPLRNGRVMIDDCGLRALPAGLARFAGEIDSLTFQEERVDGADLRGVALPKLEQLNLGGSPGLRYLRGEDLAGFPNLTELGLENTRLVSLDADIITVCPQLARVTITGTPFAERADAVAELRAKWPGVTRWD